MSNETKVQFIVEAFDKVDDAMSFCREFLKNGYKPIVVIPYNKLNLDSKPREMDVEFVLTRKGESYESAKKLRNILALQEGWGTLEPVTVIDQPKVDIIGFYELRISYGHDIAISYRPITLYRDVNRWVASFNLVGETVMNEQCASFLYRKLQDENFLVGNDFDIIACTEAKAMEMTQILSRMHSEPKHIVLRKGIKNYMPQRPNAPLIEEYDSITTSGKQQLVLDPNDLPYVSDKRILLIDDVVATGGTIRAAVRLIKKASGDVVRVDTVLLKGKHPGVNNFHYLKKSLL